MADNTIPRPGMRDVSHKLHTFRTATASATVKLSPETITLVREGRAPKGDPLAVARVAATQAAKQTPLLIPYCHLVPIEHVVVDFRLRESEIECFVTVKTVYKTGVEVEAMTAACICALNIYDLLKPVDDNISIENIHLVEKRGGKSDFECYENFQAAIITVSDRCSRGEQQDVSGQILEDGIRSIGATDVKRTTVPDEKNEILNALQFAVESEGVQVVLMTGGTGVSPRDVTPQAISPLLELRLPGLEEAFRSYGRERNPRSSLSRCTAGIYKNSLVIALPGSPDACSDALVCLFPHAMHVIPMLKGGGHA